MRTALYMKAALTLVTLTITTSACKTDPKSSGSVAIESPEVSVEGEASRAFYSDMGLGDGTTAPFEYKVKVTIRNTGGSSLKFNKVQMDIYPERGRHLTMPTFVCSKDGNCADKTPGVFKEIGPRASEDFEYGTDGYTFDLLQEANGKPLRASVSILSDDTTIAGPYIALLPPLQDLPSYEQAMIDPGKQKPMKLSFLAVQ